MGIYYQGTLFFGLLLNRAQFEAIRDTPDFTISQSYIRYLNKNTWILACPSSRHEVPETIILEIERIRLSDDAPPVNGIQFDALEAKLEVFDKQLNAERASIKAGGKGFAFGPLELFSGEHAVVRDDATTGEEEEKGCTATITPAAKKTFKEQLVAEERVPLDGAVSFLRSQSLIGETVEPKWRLFSGCWTSYDPEDSGCYGREVEVRE